MKAQENHGNKGLMSRAGGGQNLGISEAAEREVQGEGPLRPVSLAMARWGFFGGEISERVWLGEKPLTLHPHLPGSRGSQCPPVSSFRVICSDGLDYIISGGLSTSLPGSRESVT